MSATRRVFLRMAGASALAAAAGCGREAEVSRPRVRLAMVLDAARCAGKDGCRSCVDACHRAHNVPAIGNPRHEVKWVWKERVERLFPDEASVTLPVAWKGRRVLALCNHCDNPPCVRVCPAGATWRREDGLVTIDQHRCIGCRYCVAACPYGSRSFNWTDPRAHLSGIDPGFPTRTKGVVEKCNFCEERLGRGEQPACVEACPERALAFGAVDDGGGEVRRLLDARVALRRKPELGTRPQVYYLVETRG